MASTNPAPTCVQTITIPAGGSMVIPAGARIISVDGVDPTSLQTPCPELEDQLQNAEQMQCYKFTLGVDDDSNDNHVMDAAKLVALHVGGQSYPLDLVASRIDNFDFGPAFTALIPAGLIKFVSGVKSFDGDKRDEYTLKVKIAPKVAQVTTLEFYGYGFPDNAFVKPLSTDC